MYDNNIEYILVEAVASYAWVEDINTFECQTMFLHDFALTFCRYHYHQHTPLALLFVDSTILWFHQERNR